jgi:3-dehydroquinate dehydratase
LQSSITGFELSFNQSNFEVMIIKIMHQEDDEQRYADGFIVEYW